MAHSHGPSISARAPDVVLPNVEPDVAAPAVCPRPVKSRQRILYIVNQTPRFAGIERVVDSVAQELSTRFDDRFDISVLYLTAYEQIVGADRNYRILLKTDRRRWKMLWNVRTVIAEGRYDLVVVAQVEPTTLFWLATIGLDRNIAMHLHGNPRLDRRSRKARIMFALMNAFVLRRLAAVFGTSPRQLEIFKTDYPSAVPHAWLANPVRDFGARPERSASADEPVCFVSVGRFDYQKGQDILIRAFAAFSRLRPKARLRLVGFGADEPMLRALIGELGVEETVSLEHFPDSPEIPLSRSDVYLSGSRWEGWSLAICEGLRFGLPVIAFDCDFGPSDIIADDRLGRLVPMGDMDGFVQAMLHYHDNIALERRHAAYRASYIDRFSIGEVVHIHADALASAASAGRSVRQAGAAQGISERRAPVRVKETR